MRAAPSDTAVYDSFNDAFPEEAVHHSRPGAPARGLDAVRERAFFEVRRRTLKQGWTNVTLVSLHPFPLDHNMGYLGHLTIPAKKLGEMYAIKVLNQPRFDAADRGDSKFEYTPVFPKELAEDFVAQFKDMGGVFCYEGEGPVPADLVDAATESQLNWYWLKFKEGNDNWSQFNKNSRYIDDRMRDAAKELFRLKLVNHQPEWITISKAESPDAPCEGCGVTLSKLAKFCPSCHTIFDSEWVRARRPDLWKAQNPEPDPSPAARTRVADVPDIDKFVDEEAAGTAPVGKASTQFKKK